jgi:LCP family protein required for cell wall assembly
LDKRSGNNAAVRTVIIAVLVIITLGTTAIAAAPYLRERLGGSSSESQPALSENGGASEDGKQQESDAWKGESNEGLVTYNGKKYRYNSHLSNYLLLGIDTEGEIAQEKETLSGGQSDAIFLVAYDRKEETAQILAIPRDTMTTIYIYNIDGTYVTPQTDHLTLQYAYGDGREMSCKITRDAVSNLLYGVPIIGYAAINLDSIPLLVDTVGGVTLTVPDDSMEEVNPDYKKGAEITLTSETAEHYIRYRDTHAHHQALVRTERQKSFINAFADRVLELQAQDPHTITDIYETLKPHMVTNMSNDIFLDLAGAKRVGEIRTIPGEGVATDLFDEYHVDDKALYELILEVFYIEEP